MFTLIENTGVEIQRIKLESYWNVNYTNCYLLQFISFIKLESYWNVNERRNIA